MLVSLALAALGGNIMASSVALNGGADQIYKSGPEDLVAASRTIVAGPVSGYSREVRKYSQPGPDGFPLEWIASGRIDQPILIKGEAVRGPISFSREERSFFVPVNPEDPVWERDFGSIAPNGQVVLFLSGVESRQPAKALPSTGEQDLIELVRGTVAIQAISDPIQQRQAWLRFLSSARSDEARRVAMRSLVRTGADWSQMARPLQTLFLEPGVSRNIKTFSFGFVAFYVTEEKWSKESSAAVDLLCQVFSAERESTLEIQYLQSFKLILRYTAEQPRSEMRQSLQRRIMETLERRASTGVEDPTLRQEYQRIRDQYRIR
jgi:hypothetical protein